MNRTQYIVITVILALFCLLYFVLDTKPSSQKLEEMSRVNSFETTSIQILMKESKSSIDKDMLDYIEALEVQLYNAEDADKNNYREQLSSVWFKAKQAAIAGHYAEQIAKDLETESAWSIAGTSYIYGLKEYQDKRTKDFCLKRAKDALEKAISINPDNVDHRINLALAYTDHPPEDNPMTGILQLIALNKKHPKNVVILNQLARLGMQTGQYDKAIGRLQTAYEIDPSNKITNCQLAKAYEAVKNEVKALEYRQKCEKL